MTTCDKHPTSTALFAPVENAMRRVQTDCCKLIVKEGKKDWAELSKYFEIGVVPGIYLFSEPRDDCDINDGKDFGDEDAISRISRFLREERIIYVGHCGNVKKRISDHTAMSIENRIEADNENFLAPLENRQDDWQGRYVPDDSRPITRANTLAFEMAKVMQPQARKRWTLKTLLQQHQTAHYRRLTHFSQSEDK